MAKLNEMVDVLYLTMNHQKELMDQDANIILQLTRKLESVLLEKAEVAEQLEDMKVAQVFVSIVMTRFVVIAVVCDEMLQAHLSRFNKSISLVSLPVPH